MKAWVTTRWWLSASVCSGPVSSRTASAASSSGPIERGVRVYRPVPPTTHLIINPDGLTPLTLGVGAAAIMQAPIDGNADGR